MIRIDTLRKQFPDRGNLVNAVDGLSFEVPEGELYTLLGPSGCGKTTTLRCVAGLERPDSGEITLGETVVFSSAQYVPTYQRDIGMVFQSYAIWPHMTVFENVAFPLRVSGERYPRKHIDESVERSLDQVGLAGYEDRMATQLSGGQQQRLSLARALVRQPKVLLLDEPLSNLDAKLREHMRQEIRLLQQRLNITTLFVTHDQIEALAMSDRVAVLRDGQIEQEGTPEEIYTNPASEFVADFVGGSNLVTGTVLSRSTGAVVVETKFGPVTAVPTSGVSTAEGTDVAVAFRPEDLVLLERGAVDPGAANTWPVEVMLSSFTGAITDFRVVTESGQEISVRSPSRNASKERYLFMHAPAAICRLLPRSGVVTRA
ncbi:MAG: hypothetical protein JWR58_1814 [Pseudonocardia sp.]|jgi:iron(III) transport system ATP-binding protein|nr:hypothetical protein [Pseudonocardia sp.]